ncbi:MgtC/SapB family protein [Erwinia pyrifoliae]|uniref:MgtC/SapB family protein n=1 Tax=Erwinia pyrifoliae TaxID=79967 RepID=A0ABY5X833_ERWPY|nr:MgtC/SapB family protein [Erwinia pyrifoliae]AUX71126.1 hypothetical protein CPI84_00410 [Erwinia pyrifoliae]MCA8875162.1 hypothetical protein [Erwinia pyrifoliae]MCT2385520.1 MgtC/SapB family protein [Erwinia pyrifoliae]MCU8588907.1 MgtC/SapB family protein [Erwinia pyrifoliae]UWS29256.1 MgtC/SapB family protein [Erwinia pyrifoliae]
MAWIPFILHLTLAVTLGAIIGVERQWRQRMAGLRTHALLFALAVAVGLTPEMLPMIVSSNLAKGAIALPKRK